MTSDARSSGGQPIHNITSTYQSGGITAHTVNFAAMPRNLNDQSYAPLRDQLLRELPRTHVIKVESPLGDGEAEQFARQIIAFLSANDFKMSADGLSRCVFTEPQPPIAVARPNLDNLAPAEVIHLRIGTNR